MRNLIVSLRRGMSVRKQDEQGNLIVALIIILVLSTIAAALAYRVIGNEGTVVTRQNNAAAVSKADAGISDALFRLDQGTTGTGTGSYFCVNAAQPNDTNCIAPIVPGAPNVSYVATQVTTTDWLIRSVGEVNGKYGAVQESADRTSMYPFAVFGNTALNFNGNAGTSLSTYAPTQPPSETNPNMDGAVAIGSNGTITCNGGIGANVQADYYGTGGVGSLSSSCGTPNSFSDTYPLPIPAAPNNMAPNCPGNGIMGSTSSTGLSTLPAGTYLCTTPITISGLLQVSGQVQLYVILDPSQYGSSTNAVTITRGSYVNDMADYCAANPTDTTNCTGTYDLPSALNFQLFSNSTGTVGNDNGQPGYWFGGILYAPQASLTQDGCGSHYYGSLTINLLTCEGGPHLYVSYDSELATDWGPWTASAYQQVNPSSVLDLFAPTGTY